MAALRQFLTLNAQILYWTFIAPFVGKPPVRIDAIFQQMVRMGVQAVPMAALTSLSIGLTLAMQGSHELARMGATSYVPDLLSITLLRELAPLLTGVVVIGRSGSAITAELGTMKVSEEIEALEVMSINPVRFLVAPRVIAMIIMLPCLVVFSNYIGFVGGWIICNFALDINTTAYIMRLVESADMMDLISGMTKSFVFGWLISVISCQSGLSVTGGAEGVGRSTTKSVVLCILVMLVVNALLTGMFFIIEGPKG
ncbi:phospholipid/cholesterol/gamma-HCH transport system permease protein [Terrimicrobium sacchariphilum]|uniref:Phospholipid/cholesterol/gamma-HCH transport system permease protein n=1 Tax=Terrimicrobium sacchariphilum TaxID=690879 RepID=A0A146GBQ1_TERSA|nr:ABC transporter permease [Terrimicrobium sacchariphilum]GAT34622.1 phospholipid/cholesterol/gamma-HCH transport system permease protein [Terrimicrobium sacchariphilum]